MVRDLEVGPWGGEVRGDDDGGGTSSWIEESALLSSGSAYSGFGRLLIVFPRPVGVCGHYKGRHLENSNWYREF